VQANKIDETLDVSHQQKLQDEQPAELAQVMPSSHSKMD
jgi:hypothetical protein